jgi:hydroxypyruvate reductase
MTDKRPCCALFSTPPLPQPIRIASSRHTRRLRRAAASSVCLQAAAGALAFAAERHYLDEGRIDPAKLSGLATTRHGYGKPTQRIEIVEAGHPVPDEAGLKAASRTLDLARTAGDDDLVLVLLSGGGSANWIAPADGVSFAQKQAMNKSLLRSGAPIGEMNTVRKHLSRIKGGRLARAAAPAKLDTGDFGRSIRRSGDHRLGPTVPDTTTLADAREIVARYRIKADDAVIAALNDPANESCKPGDAAFANRFQDHRTSARVARRRGRCRAQGWL